MLSNSSLTTILKQIREHAPTASIDRLYKIISASSDILEGKYSDCQVLIEECFTKKGWELPKITDTSDRTGIFKSYPDVWSFLLETLTMFRKYRKIWGDKKALELTNNFQTCLPDGRLVWEWRHELYMATAPDWRRRKVKQTVEENLSIAEDLRPHYEANLVAVVMNFAIDRQWAKNTDPQAGEDHPLRDEAYQAQKRDAYLENCKVVAWDIHQATTFFTQFWEDVRSRRGQVFAENLRRDVAGSYGEMSERYRQGYYSSDRDFRSFLGNMDTFKRGGTSGRIANRDFSKRLNPGLEGLIQKDGIQAVRSICLLSVLNSGDFHGN